MSVCLSLSPSQSLGRASLVWRTIFRAPRSCVGHWLGTPDEQAKPSLPGCSFKNDGCGAMRSRSRTAGLMVQMKCEFAGREGEAWPMFYESWLRAHSLSQGWTSTAFLDTTLRVLRVIGDVQSVTYSISAAIDLKVWDCCRFITWQKCRGGFSSGDTGSEGYDRAVQGGACTWEKTQRLFPFHEGADITKRSTKRGSLRNIV